MSRDDDTQYEEHNDRPAEETPGELAPGRSIHSQSTEEQAPPYVQRYGEEAHAAVAPPAPRLRDGGAANLGFGSRGLHDPGRTLTAAEAYFLSQVIRDVNRAFDRVARDFRQGRFDPGGGRLAGEFEDLLQEARDRPDEQPEHDQLDAAFADGGVDEIMDALAAALDAYETGRAEAARAPASGLRNALERQIESFAGDLTQRGTPGLMHAVDTLWDPLTRRLAFLQSNHVRRYAGNGADTDPAVALATLSDAPVTEVRARANRANAVRLLSGNVAKLDFDNWHAVGAGRLIDDCAPVALWPREEHGVPTLKATDSPDRDDAEAERIRIQRRDASWRTLS